MKKEIELVKRKPTFDYILNDLAFESLKLKVIHGIASNQDKFDFDYQLKLKDKEINRLNNIINELENILKLMINHGYCDTPNGDYEGTTVQGFMATGEDSEFGVRAKFILYKLKELKESGNNE